MIRLLCLMLAVVPVNSDEGLSGDSQKGMVAQANVHFEIPADEKVRKAVGSEISRMARKHIIEPADIHSARMRMQNIVDRSGMVNARVVVDYQFIIDGFTIRFTVKAAPDATAGLPGSAGDR